MAAREAHGKGMQSYLCIMAIRLTEMRRVLKATASIYLHCDDAARHYLKLLMDSIFGASCYRNHLVGDERQLTTTDTTTDGSSSISCTTGRQRARIGIGKLGTHVAKTYA